MSGSLRKDAERPTYSVVIPSYNEAESLENLLQEVQEVMTSLERRFEVIIVDDGSTDNSLPVLGSLQENYKWLEVHSFSRNMGKSEAYSSGFQAARGDIVITLDADLQDDPKELPKLLKKIEEGLDLVIGKKNGRRDNEPLKAIASAPFNRALALLFGLHITDSNSGFRVMKSAVAKNLDLYGDLYRFIPQMAYSLGFSVTEVPVEHRKRRFGKSHYGPKRFITGALDLFTIFFLTTFTKRPLHFFGSFGIIGIVLGSMLETYVLIYKMLGSPFQMHLAAIITGVLLITLGVLSFFTGLIAELLVAQYRVFSRKRSATRRRYIVRDRQSDGA